LLEKSFGNADTKILENEKGNCNLECNSWLDGAKSEEKFWLVWVLILYFSVLVPHLSKGR